MTRKTPKRGLPPLHPGELLREEILPALARPKTEMAKLLGVSRPTLYDIIDKKQPATPVMALRLGKLRQRSRSLAQSSEAVRSAPRPAATWGQDQDHPDIGRRLTRGLNAEVLSKAGWRSSSID